MSHYTRGLRFCQLPLISNTQRRGTCRLKGPVDVPSDALSEALRFVIPGVKKLGQASETVSEIQWVSAAAPTMAADRILMFLHRKKSAALRNAGSDRVLTERHLCLYRDR